MIFLAPLYVSSSSRSLPTIPQCDGVHIKVTCMSRYAKLCSCFLFLYSRSVWRILGDHGLQCALAVRYDDDITGFLFDGLRVAVVPTSSVWGVEQQPSAVPIWRVMCSTSPTCVHEYSQWTTPAPARPSSCSDSSLCRMLGLWWRTCSLSRPRQAGGGIR